MADKKTSQFDDAALLTGDELIGIIQPITGLRGNKKITIDQLMTFAPVQLVNGQSGEVILAANDVGALAPGDNIGDLVNDVGYITGIDISGPNILLGRYSPGVGTYQEITLGGGLLLSSEGVLSSAGGGGLPGGSNTQVQFNSSDSFAGDSTLTFDSTNKILSSNIFRSILSADPSETTNGNIFYSSEATVLDYRARINGYWSNITRPGLSAKTNFAISESERGFVSYIDTSSNRVIDISGAPLSPHWAQTFINDGNGTFSFNVGLNTLRAQDNFCSTRYGAVTLVHAGGGIYYAFGALGESDGSEDSDSDSGGASTEGNAITIIGDTINLGGVQTNNISIIPDTDSTYQFVIGQPGLGNRVENVQFYVSQAVTFWDNGNNIFHYSPEDGEAFWNVDNEIIISAGGATQLAIRAVGSPSTFGDAQNIGLNYEADYRANYLARTLADWGNVISQLGGKDLDANVITPTFDEDGYVLSWDHDEQKYVLVPQMAGGDDSDSDSGGGGITNSGAANELVKSNGTNVVGTGMFSTTAGNLILGSLSTAGPRYITATSSNGVSDLILLPGNSDSYLRISRKNIGEQLPYLVLGGTTDSNVQRRIITTDGEDITNTREVGGARLYTFAFSHEWSDEKINIQSSGSVSPNGKMIFYPENDSSNGALQVGTVSDGEGEYSALDGVSGVVNGGQTIVRGGNAYTGSGNGNGGNLIVRSGQRRTAGSGVDGNLLIDSLTGVIKLVSTPVTSTDTADHVLIRDVTDGEVKKLPIGGGLTIAGGALAMAELNPDTYYYESDHFMGGTTGLNTTGHGWVSGVTSGGFVAYSTTTPLAIATTENVQGAVQLQTASGTGDGARMFKGSTSITFGLGDTITIGFRVAVSALSDGTDTYTINIGTGDVSSGNDTDAIAFRYTHGTNSGRYQTITRSNGTETANDSGVAPTGGIFDILEFVVNGAGTSVEFYVNGSLVQTHTTNIPNGSGRQLGPGFRINKSAGTSARSLVGDWYRLLMTRTAAR